MSNGIFEGSSGPEKVVAAESKALRIRVGDENNVVASGAGHDRIAVGNGANTIAADDGNNLVVAGDGDNSVNTGTGADRIYVGDGDNILNAGTGPNNIIVGVGENTILTGDGADVITAGGGNNTIDAGGGANRVRVGDGDNAIKTGSENDRIGAGEGHNSIDAGDGDNLVVAGNGNNTIVTGYGADRIFIGDGNNTINAGGGTNRIIVGSGDNIILTGGGNDVITGGNGDNTIHAGSGNNRVRTGEGDNVIETGNADDRIAVGNGDNMITAGDGDNLVVAGRGQNVIQTGSGADRIYVGDGVNEVYAGMGNDYILAAGGNNEVHGGGGDDVVRTGAGDDKVWGGQGNDKLFGGDGYDVAFFAGSFADYILDRTVSKVSITGAGDAGTDYLNGFEAVYFEGDDVMIDISADAPPVLFADHVQSADSDPLVFSLTTLLENDFSFGDLPSTFIVSALSSRGVRVTFDGENITYNADDALRHLGDGEVFQDGFTYAVADPVAGSIEATVNVTITGKNDAPEAVDDRLIRAIPSPASYQGNEIATVNTKPAGFQLDHSIASFSDGKSVFVWADGSAIKARVLSADGTEFATEFQVNEQIGGAQRYPVVTVLANGNFVVSWDNVNAFDPEKYPLSARVFEPDGSAVTPEFSVDKANTNNEIFPKITALENSGFVISWTELNSQTKDWNIKAAIFDDNGAKTTSDFILNKETWSSQQYESITALPGGGFIATWHSNDGADPSNSGIKARTFDANGQVVIDEFLVNETTTGSQWFPTVSAREDGSFAVVWYTQEDGYDYKGRIFNADGSAASSDFGINGTDLRVGTEASLTWLPSGHLLVAWLQHQPDDFRNANGEIWARIFNVDGTPVVDEFTVSETPARSHPSLSVLADGRFVIAWESGENSGTGYDIKSRTYDFGDVVEEQPFTTEDNPITISVADLLANDSDIDGDTLAFSLDTVTSKFGAQLTYDPVTGDLMYDPTVSAALQAMNEGDVLEDQFTYTVSDGNGSSDQATVTLLIRGKDGFEVVIDEDLAANDDYLASGGMTHSPELVARNEFKVNESDARWHEEPSVVTTDEGGSIIVWASKYIGEDEAGDGIRARILDANGTEVVSEFKVDLEALSRGGSPAVTLLSDGMFVVAWRQLEFEPGVGYFMNVKLRLFNADGSLASEEFAASQVRPQSDEVRFSKDAELITLANGNFVVSWTSELKLIDDALAVHQYATYAYETRATIFTAQGERVVDDFHLGDKTTWNLSHKISPLPDGGFVVTWIGPGSPDPTGPNSIRAQIYDDQGEETFPDFLVNETTEGFLNAPDVSANSDGSFVVVWHSRDAKDGTGLAHLRASVFNPDGTVAVNEFDVMSTTQASPGATYGTVQYLPNGQFVVAWNDYENGGNTYQDVFARIYNSDGTAASEEFLVNQHTSEHQFDPYISVLDDDSFMIAWRSLDGSGTSDSNISARIYDLTGQPIEEYYTDEDNAVSIDTQLLLANDVYSDQDTFIFALDTATSDLGAILEYDADTGHLIYDPTAANGIQMLNNGETLEDKFTYSLTNAEGKTTLAEVVILVGGVDEFEQSSVEEYVFV